MTNLTSEAQRILELIAEKKNFLLSGGAGSGKTYSLVEVIQGIIMTNPQTRIACITYTNSAADEIDERFKSPNVAVSTIHDFLWSNIKHFQQELKRSLIMLAQEDKLQLTTFEPLAEGIKEEENFTFPNGIQYREFLRIKEGIISHNEVIVLAEHLFRHYPKLINIVKDRYQVILVDEYQDTSPLVVKILLDHFSTTAKKCTIGFFGDSMQSIYEDTVGSLQEYVDREEISEVQKIQNRRNPRKVIELANKLRLDDLQQEPSKDLEAPNMDANGIVKEGNIQFLFSSDDNLDSVRNFLNWSDDDEKKELNLTHRLNASKAGFEQLMEVYGGDKILDYVVRVRDFLRDNPLEHDLSELTFSETVELLLEEFPNQKRKINPTKAQEKYIAIHEDEMNFINELSYNEISTSHNNSDYLLDPAASSSTDSGRPGSRCDDLIKHLHRIYECLTSYEDKDYGQFIRLTSYKIGSIKDKQNLFEIMNKFSVAEITIGEVIKEADQYGIVKIDDRLEQFIEEKPYVYFRVGKIPFKEFISVYNYKNESSPFSTQHKTKGREFPNILVVLDNGGWNNYNYEYLFTNDGSESVRERTAKIFYVCCTRAMENLAVFYHTPSEQVLAKAREWFGIENVINLDTHEAP